MRYHHLLAVTLLVVTGTASADPPDGATTRISATSGKARTFSFRPWMSADGRVVAYDADVEGIRDVYVFDRVTSTTERVSVAGDGTRGDGASQRPTVSADGRYVAFWSRATNLVPGDTNRRADAFVHDRQSGTTVRVSVGSDGTQGNGDSARPVISGDGHLVAFESAASNLVPGDTDRVRDIFVHDLAAGTTTRVAPGLRPSISDDGRWIAFNSDAALVAGDTNRASDIYVVELTTGQTERMSVASGGGQARGGSYSPSLSADGALVAFWSDSPTLVPGDANRAADVFVHDRTTGETAMVSVAGNGEPADGLSSDPDISPDGRFVAFWSKATDLVPGDTNGADDVFVRDRAMRTTIRVSVATDGTQSDGNSFSPNVSAGGGVVAFDSLATNLVPGEADRGSNVFVHTRPT